MSECGSIRAKNNNKSRGQPTQFGPLFGVALIHSSHLLISALLALTCFDALVRWIEVNLFNSEKVDPVMSICVVLKALRKHMSKIPGTTSLRNGKDG